MIDNKTKKQYVYRLKHKPSGKYFVEVTLIPHHMQSSSVAMDVDGVRLFSTPTQIGKVWARIEKAKKELEVHRSIVEQINESTDRLEKVSKYYEKTLQTMSEMEIEILELQPVQGDEVRKVLEKEIRKEQAVESLKSRISTIAESEWKTKEIYDKFKEWENLENKEELSHIVILEKSKEKDLKPLEKLEKIGIKPYVFDVLLPRVIALREGELNFIKLSGNIGIQNAIEISKIVELKNQIDQEFGLLP